MIYNRLADGMLLQFDSTTRYATGNYTRPLTESELHSRRPYNTHTHQGLPPTPINNPGLASIHAAAHPAQTNYLFFVTPACGKAPCSRRTTRSSWICRPVPEEALLTAGPDPAPAALERSGAKTRLGVLGWPVPTVARRRSRTPRSRPPASAAWRYQLLPAPPELFAELVRALPGPGFAAST